MRVISWMLLARLEAYTENLKEQVEAKDQKLQQIGYENYLNQ
jgi:5-(carboxyamino)imidazole ribonucleotide mutase